MTIPLTGYADRLSVRPGETISFHVSHQNPSQHKVRTEVVRVVSGDPHVNPGPGIQTLPLQDEVKLECLQEPGPCTVQRGSWAELPLPEDAVMDKGMTLVVNILPTLVNQTKQTIAFIASVLELYMDKEGYLCLQLFGGNEQTTTVIRCSKQPLPQNHWIQVYCSLDVDSAQATVGWNWLSKDGGGASKGREGDLVKQSGTETIVKNHKENPKILGQSTLFLAAARSDNTTGNNSSSSLRTCHHFTGRMEHPWLWWNTAVFPELQVGMHAVGGASTTPGVFAPPDAQWHFGRNIATQTVQDVGPHKLQGQLFNCPTRGVKGSHWSGREMCWRHAPDDYAAIHFHAETDLSDCHWPVCYQWTLPPDLKSGNYALLLLTNDYTDNIPFFVVPPKQGKPQAKVVVVMSTFTYVIYGNHARNEWVNEPGWDSARKNQVKQNPGAYPYHPREHPAYGWSTYNTHPDGSGISLASWKRPMMNLRLGYITFPITNEAASGLRHYPADTHLTAWLEAQGIAYDIVTDWELHTEGHAVLEPYRVVLTGSHPEYHTEESLNAFRDYRNNGGRLMSLGGNGFYWRIAVGKDAPVLEIRRGEGGIRAWASPAGEYYNQLDGQYGGLWRNNGRAPQALAGVGFSAQGNFVGSHYRLRDSIRDNPRVAWMFQGVEDTGGTIGGHGLSGHGAAGFELDRADVRLGTPEHTLIVASSEGHSAEHQWLLVFEERLTHHGNLVGVPDQDLIRADITFFETLSGGAVFSTGSITYCGSLLTNNCQNDISMLTKNVLVKFLDQDAVITMPDL